MKMRYLGPLKAVHGALWSDPSLQSSLRAPRGARAPQTSRARLGRGRTGPRRPSAGFGRGGSASVGHLLGVVDRAEHHVGAPRGRSVRRNAAAVIGGRETLRIAPEPFVVGPAEPRTDLQPLRRRPEPDRRLRRCRPRQRRPRRREAGCLHAEPHRGERSRESAAQHSFAAPARAGASSSDGHAASGSPTHMQGSGDGRSSYAHASTGSRGHQKLVSAWTPIFASFPRDDARTRSRSDCCVEMWV